MSIEEHMNDAKLLRNYIRTERASYSALLDSRPASSLYADHIEKWLNRTRRAWNSLNAKGVKIPDYFLAPYPFPKATFLPEDFEELIKDRNPIFYVAQAKYQLRAHNILREFDRCCTLYPEALDTETTFDILELSAGGCGGAEVAKHFGNTYTATDFLAGRGSVYAPIHRALGLNVIDFDGSTTPYSFSDNSFDVVACFQAIDAYGFEEEYATFIDEMIRIARQKVVIIFNPGIRAKREALESGFEYLIKAPLAERYDSIEISSCPSTGAPAMTIDPRLQCVASST